MEFAQAWDSFSVGDVIVVANGEIEPGREAQPVAWAAWRSHNFSGTILEKIDGTPRALRIELPERGGATLVYCPREGDGHRFEPTGDAAPEVTETALLGQIDDIRCAPGEVRQAASLVALLRWRELTDFNLLAAAELTLLTPAQRARRWPLLAGLAQELGKSLRQTADAIEPVLWPQVRATAIREARLTVAAERVRAAATTAAKRAALDLAWIDAPET